MQSKIARPAAAWDRSVLYHGIAAGAAGAIVVAAFFLVLDIAAGRPFYTPAFLGSWLFLDQPPGWRWNVTTALVLGYSVVHAGVFIGIGAVAAFVAADRQWAPRPAVLLATAVGLWAAMQIVFLVLGLVLDHSLLDELGWGRVALGNLVAAFAMSPIVLGAHSDPETRP